ncbi:hypothetical protein SLS62_001615 [Diatrype stigma]|uniref:Uncharacterized protein n=1 Tax=Diatrype stigma TaxID=117547 RepID=A0AAN9V895_9PEZI
MAVGNTRAALVGEARPQHDLVYPTYQPAPQTAHRGKIVLPLGGRAGLPPSLMTQPASMHVVRLVTGAGAYDQGGDDNTHTNDIANSHSSNDEDHVKDSHEHNDDKEADEYDEDEDDGNPTPTSSSPSTPSTTPPPDETFQGMPTQPLVAEGLEENAGGSLHEAPAGANLCLVWDARAGPYGRFVAYKKDHFTGAVRPRRMMDDMFDNASAEKMAQYKRRYCEVDDDDDEDDDDEDWDEDEDEDEEEDSEGPSTKRRKLEDGSSASASSSGSAEDACDGDKAEAETQRDGIADEDGDER